MNVRPANHSDAPQILDLLVKVMPGGNKPGARARWQKLFAIPWQEPQAPSGYLLEEDRSIKGFIGTLFSKRRIGSKTYSLINLTTWAVEVSCRSASLSLLAPILALKDHTITDLSASPQAAAVLQALGFKPLDNQRICFPALPLFAPGKSLSLSFDKESIIRKLTPEQQEHFLAHKGTGCFHTLAITAEGTTLYLIGTVRYLRGIRSVYIHYCSNKSLFAEYAGQLAWQLGRKLKAMVMLIDSRLCENKNQLRGIYFRQTLKTPMLYRSAEQDFPVQELDNLYTECVLLMDGG